MSSNSPPSESDPYRSTFGVHNVKRKDYDMEEMERRAALRRANNGSINTQSSQINNISNSDRVREEFRSAAPSGSKQAYLKAREKKINFDGVILGSDKTKNDSRLIQSSAIDNTGSGNGFWCDVCGILVKDDMTYLDHINGKNHLSKLGYGKKIERVSVEKVREKLAEVKKKKEKQLSMRGMSAKEIYQDRINTTKKAINDKRTKEDEEKELKKQKRREMRQEQAIKRKLENISGGNISVDGDDDITFTDKRQKN